MKNHALSRQNITDVNNQYQTGTGNNTDIDLSSKKKSHNTIDMSSNNILSDAKTQDESYSCNQNL